VRELLTHPRDARRVREFALRFDWNRATQGQLAIFRALAGRAERGVESRAALPGSG
jgi:hypothetical protein